MEVWSEKTSTVESVVWLYVFNPDIGVATILSGVHLFRQKVDDLF